MNTSDLAGTRPWDQSLCLVISDLGLPCRWPCLGTTPSDLLCSGLPVSPQALATPLTLPTNKQLPCLPPLSSGTFQSSGICSSYTMRSQGFAFTFLIVPLLVCGDSSGEHLGPPIHSGIYTPL